MSSSPRFSQNATASFAFSQPLSTAHFGASLFREAGGSARQKRASSHRFVHNSNENLRSIMDYWALRSIVAVDGGGMTPELRRVATDLDLEFWRI
jgi:hypothetical protein